MRFRRGYVMGNKRLFITGAAQATNKIRNPHTALIHFQLCDLQIFLIIIMLLKNWSLKWCFSQKIDIVWPSLGTSPKGDKSGCACGAVLAYKLIDFNLIYLAFGC